MKYLLMLTGLMVMPSFAAGDLAADDMTGVSFWLVTAALLAATVFFFVERDNVINCVRSCYRYCFLALHVHERCMGRYSDITYRIQIY